MEKSHEISLLATLARSGKKFALSTIKILAKWLGLLICAFICNY
ncbi:hypothetical protein HMPREF3224_00772 [Anaerococcus hydrogenalis]|nr:hypothetical protein HMPREF3224_00772 [Anaerococcus hydrogenalis]